MATRLPLCLWALSALCCLPVAAQDPPAAPAQCVVVVGLHWPDHDLGHAQVRVFRDAARRDLVEAFPSMGPEGRIIVALTPGTYYLTAVVDLNNDGQLNAGDGLAFYGVEDPNTQQPQPLEVKAGVAPAVVRMPISLTMLAEGRLAPTGVKLPVLVAPPTPRDCRISGTLTGGAGKLRVCLVVAGDGSFSRATLPAADGSFSLVVPTGKHYVFAAEDLNDTEGLDPGDLFAVAGYRAEQGAEFPTLDIAGDVADLALTLQWRVSETGRLQSLDGTTDGPQVALETLPAVLLGTVEGVPAGSGAAISACTDARFTGLAETIGTPDGHFTLALGAGVYYLNAVSLKDAAAAPGGGRAAGDRIGFYGVSDLRLAHGPQPVALRPGELRHVSLALVAQFDEQLRPVPLTPEPGH